MIVVISQKDRYIMKQNKDHFDHKLNAHFAHITVILIKNKDYFGNGYFGTTAITSAGSNGNGSLFEYDVPSGYYAINTKNINTYG